MTTTLLTAAEEKLLRDQLANVTYERNNLNLELTKANMRIRDLENTRREQLASRILLGILSRDTPFSSAKGDTDLIELAMGFTDRLILRLDA